MNDIIRDIANTLLTEANICCTPVAVEGPWHMSQGTWHQVHGLTQRLGGNLGGLDVKRPGSNKSTLAVTTTRPKRQRAGQDTRSSVGEHGAS